jgi:hypothetical protein
MGTWKRESVAPPIYDVVGWVAEQDAAEIKEKISPTTRGRKFQRSTISRWRYNGYIHGISINGKLVLVNVDQVKKFDGVPMGNPGTMGAEQPDKQPPLPDTITLTLKRRKVPK